MPEATTMSDAQTWQRLAPLALVFLILNGLQQFIRQNLFFFVGAGAGVAFLDWLGPRELLLGGLAIVLIALASAVIYHRRFRFRIEDDAVRVRKGLFEKKELRVRFARIQNIQLGEPFYFRPFGLVRFSLETPGAAEKEVELPGIPRALAESMRDRIAGFQAGPQDDETDSLPAEQASVNGDLLFSAGMGRLFIHGMSSHQVWLILGAIAYLFGSLAERLTQRLEDVRMLQALADTVTSGWMLLLIVFLLLVGVLFLLSGVLSVIRFFDFRLSDRDGRLVAVGGLLDRREQTVARDKITGLTLKQLPLGRLLGSWHLLIRQTQSGQQQDPTNMRQGLLVPGLWREDFYLVHDLVAGWDVPEAFEPVSGHFRRFFWTRWLVLAGTGVAISAWQLAPAHPLTLGLAASLVLVPALIQLRFRRWGVHVQGRQIWVRQGLVGQSLEVFDLERVQQVRVSQSPYQRRHRVANLQLILPQGGVTVPFLPLDAASELANRALYAAETATLHRV
jgi:putative membrane protein